jgi:hypothetical protein
MTNQQVGAKALKKALSNYQRARAETRSYIVEIERIEMRIRLLRELLAVEGAVVELPDGLAGKAHPASAKARLLRRQEPQAKTMRVR